MSTYVPIQAITVSAGTTTIDFTGVPQTFTDLVIVANLRGNNVNTSTGIRFNSDTATNYSLTGMSGEGANPISYRNTTSDRILLVSGSANWNSTWGTILINIPNYTNTTTNKTVLIRSGSSNGEVVAHAGVWRKTPEAITSITIFAPAGSWAADTTFTLYGIGSGAPKAFGGDEVRTDGTYWYHIFRSSGRFEPVQALTVDCLVVAGGGGGGGSDTAGEAGGGGGAGGFRTGTGLSVVSNTAYTVTVGAGGAGGTSSSRDGVKGNDSIFSTITSTGGGFGGGVQNGGNGGSGGGTPYSQFSAGTGNTPSTSPSQGNNGGLGGATTRASGAGGGGGASAAGGNAASDVGGTGGAGTASSITGTSVTYAGGGGGGGATNGTGGSGGGGTGGTSPTAGTANTGGGGGGKENSGSGGAGGSGIVVIRYSAV